MDDTQPQAVLQQLIAVGVLALAAFAVLLLGGVFSESSFDSSPSRRGNLRLADLALATGLWLLGNIAAGVALQAAQQRAGFSEDTHMMLALLAAQVGSLPAILFALGRAAVSVEGGIGGFGFTPSRLPKGVAVGALGLVAVFPLMLLVSVAATQLTVLLGGKPEMLAHAALPMLTQNLFTPRWWAMVGSAVVLAPVVEETIFRGVVQTSLRQAGLVPNRWRAIIVTSVVFAAIHGGVAQWYALPSLFVLSLGLGYVFERTGSLYASMTMHGLFNASQVALAIAISSAHAEVASLLPHL
jgi:membrane protease YdiL (CAAX protease family)